MKFPRAALTAALCLGFSLGGWMLGKWTSPSTVHLPALSPPADPGKPSITEHANTKLTDTLAPSEIPARLRRAMLMSKGTEAAWLAERWGATDPAGLFAFLMRPECQALLTDQQTLVQICFHHWFQLDYRAALTAMPRLLTIIGRTDFTSTVAASAVRELIKINSRAAVDFIMQHQNYGIYGILESDISLASLQEVAQALGPCRTRSVLGGEIYRALFDGSAGNPADPVAAKQWLAHCSAEERMLMMNVDPFIANMIEGPEQLMKSFTASDLSDLGKDAHGNEGLMNRLAQWRALQDPAAALSWAQGSLDGQDRAWAMKEILRVAAPGDAKAATEFVDAIPAGPMRDQAVVAVVEKFQRSGTAESAAAWVLSLADTKDQRAAVQGLVQEWSANDPKACAAWIQKAPESLQMNALASALQGNGFDTQVKLAAQLPEELAIQGLRKTWERTSYPDPRSIAEQAANLPAGKLRAAFMAEASGQSFQHFGYAYNERWLEWAASLPTAEDRAAALHGAEHPHLGHSGLSDSMKATATARLLGK